jgi:hypothetical protein
MHLTISEELAGSRLPRGEARSVETAGELTPALDTYANNLDNPLEARFLRREKNAEIRGTVRRITQLPRVRKCGHTVRRAAGVGIVVDLKKDSAKRISGFRGLYSCASVWACPRCSAVIGIQRSKEVRGALQKWSTEGAVIPRRTKYPASRWPFEKNFDPETGEELEHKVSGTAYVTHEPGDAAFLTLTIRHRRQDKLVDLWETISTAWQKLTRGNSILKRRVPAYIRAAELTHGKNGWHLHLHVLLFVEKGWGDEIKKVRESIFKSWISIINDLNFTVTPKGLDLRMLSNAEDEDEVVGRMAQYLTKESATWDVAQELTAAHIKKATGKNLSMHQILAVLHAAVTGIETGYTDKEITALRATYMEFELSSHGKRQLTWSNGAKAGLIDEDVSDEELAEANAEDDGVIDGLDRGTEEIAGFAGDSWERVRDSRIHLQRVVEATNSTEMNQELTAWVEKFGTRALYGFYLGDGWLERLERLKPVVPSKSDSLPD